MTWPSPPAWRPCSQLPVAPGVVMSHDTTSAPPGSAASWYGQVTAGQAAWRCNCRIPSENNIVQEEKIFSF